MMRNFSRSLRLALAALPLLLALPIAGNAQIYDKSDDDLGVWDRQGIKQAAEEAKKADEAFQAKAKPAAKDTVNSAVQSVKQYAGSGKRLTLSSSVPSSKPVIDELQYITERVGEKAGTNYEVNRSIPYLLFHSEQPSQTGLQNPSVKFTKAPSQVVGLPTSRELALAEKVANSPGNLTPGDVMRMSLEVNGGDYPAAMLTAHNFLKEITYGERQGGFAPTYMVVPGAARIGDTKKLVADLQARFGRQFEVKLNNYGRGDIEISVTHGSRSLGNKLRNLRVDGDPHGKDKMGPWYHMFGVLYLSSVAKGGRMTAESWAKMEALLRKTPFFSSRPDYFKTLLSDIAGEQSGEILDAIKKAEESQKDSKGDDGNKKSALPTDPATQKQRREHIVDQLKHLNNNKLTQLLGDLGIAPPIDLLNCLCQRAAYGTNITRQFYHPDTIGEFNKTYSCSQPGDPCVVSGYGCSRHPLPSSGEIWGSCIAENRIGASKDAKGVTVPDSGEPLDQVIERKLRERHNSP